MNDNISNFLKSFCWVDEIGAYRRKLPAPFADNLDKLPNFTPLYKYPFPTNPPKGLLISMAVRYDHSFLMPSTFLNKTIDSKNAVLTQMKQLYEEVSGNGFWKPENNDSYEIIFQKRINLGKE